MKKRRFSRYLAAGLSVVLLLSIGLWSSVFAADDVQTLPATSFGQVTLTSGKYVVESSSVLNGILIPKGEEVYIDIPSGCTLSSIGRHAQNTYLSEESGIWGRRWGYSVGSSAGITVEKGAVLHLSGDGVLNVQGGNGCGAKSGLAGEKAVVLSWSGLAHLFSFSPYDIELEFMGGQAGMGGDGAFAPSPAIGGNGGVGATGPGLQGGLDVTDCADVKVLREATTEEGRDGYNGGTMGTVYIEGTLQVTAVSGAGSYKTVGAGGTYADDERYDDFIDSSKNCRYGFISFGAPGGGGGGAMASAIIGGGGGGGGAGGAGLFGGAFADDGWNRQFYFDKTSSNGHDGTAKEGGMGGTSYRIKTEGWKALTGGAGGKQGFGGGGGRLYITGTASINGISGASLTSADLLGADGKNGGAAPEVYPLTRFDLDIKLDDAAYEGREVFLWRDDTGRSEMTETEDGSFSCFVPMDSSKTYSIYIDGINTGYSFVPAGAVEEKRIDFYTCTVSTTLDGAAYSGRKISLLQKGVLKNEMAEDSPGIFNTIYMIDARGGEYNTFDVFVDGVDAGKALTAAMGASVTLPFCTVSANIALDAGAYSGQSVSLIKKSGGELVSLMDETNTAGTYSTIVSADSTQYGIAVGADVSSTATVTAEVGASVPTVNYYTAQVTLKNGENNWSGQTVTLTGGGRIINALENGTSGVYEVVLFEEDATRYVAAVNGTTSTKTVQVTQRSTGGDKATVSFFTATVNLTKDDAAWTDGASVMLKQDGETAYVMSKSGSSFTASGVAEGSYDVYVYGSASDENTGKVVSMADATQTDAYYTVDFLKNLKIPNGADYTDTVYKTQIRRSGDTCTLASAPYQAGYTFLGWKSGTAASSADYVPSAITEHTSVYASWVSPKVTLGGFVRCNADAEVTGSGAYFKTPNLSIQGYPLTGKVIGIITLTLSNTELTNDSAPDGWKCTKQYSSADGNGKLIYQADTGEKLTVAEAQSFLRGAVYRVVSSTAEAKLQVTAYGDTNNS